jgi:hypothetical protein
MQVTESATLAEVTGGDGGAAAASPLAWARIDHGYPSDLLAAVLERGGRLREAVPAGGPRFLGLDHLRRVQDAIPEVAQLVHDRQRLAALSEIAGVELEPYPIGTSCSGINFYSPGRRPIEFHCDGPAFVELVPLHVDGAQSGGSTVVFQGPPEVGRRRLADGQELAESELQRVPQRPGASVLLQGRMLLHSAETLTDGHRVTLVLSLRSAAEPWKDNNTLGRLLNDDRPEDVVDDWQRDVDTRQLPALRAHLMS